MTSRARFSNLLKSDTEALISSFSVERCVNQPLIRMLLSFIRATSPASQFSW